MTEYRGLEAEAELELKLAKGTVWPVGWKGEWLGRSGG